MDEAEVRGEAMEREHRLQALPPTAVGHRHPCTALLRGATRAGEPLLALTLPLSQPAARHTGASIYPSTLILSPLPPPPTRPLTLKWSVVCQRGEGHRTVPAAQVGSTMAKKYSRVESTREAPESAVMRANLGTSRESFSGLGGYTGTATTPGRRE